MNLAIQPNIVRHPIETRSQFQSVRVLLHPIIEFGGSVLAKIFDCLFSIALFASTTFESQVIEGQDGKPSPVLLTINFYLWKFLSLKLQVSSRITKALAMD